MRWYRDLFKPIPHVCPLGFVSTSTLRFITQLKRPWLATTVLGRSLAALAGAVVLSHCSPSIETSDSFQTQTVELKTYNLHDLGIVDVNGDQLLDIFTTHHSALQNLAINLGSLHFHESLSQWGLDQDHNFPGLALSPDEPIPKRPGLYVNWRGTDLVVRAHELGNASELISVSGTIDALTEATVQSSLDYEVKIERPSLPADATRTIIHFSGGRNGHFVLKPDRDSVPFHFQLNNGVIPSNIYVGTHNSSPPSSDFSIHMRDRHAMAWADYNGDTQMDVFIARGALSGTLKNTPLTLWDELFIQKTGSMTDIGQSVLPDKRGCPGRQTRWVDFDRDGRLDLFINCGRGGFQSQLLRQTETGTFLDVATASGLVLTAEGKFSWIDVDENGYPDLLWVDDEHGIFIYKNHNGHFQVHHLATFKSESETAGLHLGDINGDGHADVFVESSSESRLLISGNGTFAVIRPSDLGLPQQSLAASWVDVDNDGVLELYSVPDGLYRRTDDGHYKSTGELRWTCRNLCPYTLRKSFGTIVNWADLNNDGTRDLLMATNLLANKGRWAPWMAKLLGDSLSQIGPLGGHWVAMAFTNSNHKNHWLEVNLIGPPGNHQALGARVSVETSDNRQVQEVGHAESSRFSQGHYRVYFGLGQQTRVDSLTVAWPDGSLQTLHDVQGDRLITVNWSERQINRDGIPHRVTTHVPQHSLDRAARKTKTG